MLSYYDSSISHNKFNVKLYKLNLAHQPGNLFTEELYYFSQGLDYDKSMKAKDED